MKFRLFLVIFIGVCFTCVMAILLSLIFMFDVGLTPIFALSPIIFMFVWYIYSEYIVIKSAKDDTTKTVRINDKYSIDLPSFTEPVSVSGFARFLIPSRVWGNASASLRYNKSVVNFYTYVIDRAKSDVVAEIEKMKTDGKAPNKDNPLIVDYAEMTLKRLWLYGFNTKREDSDINVGGLKGITISLLNRHKHKYYYRISFLEGKDTIYQIVSLKISTYGIGVDPFLFKMLKIVNSFREL